jgi:hypothetical protein
VANIQKPGSQGGTWSQPARGPAPKSVPASPAAAKAAKEAAKTAIQGGTPARNLEKDFVEIAEAINQFRVDTQRFFAGDVHIPPETQKDRLAARIRQLRNGGLRGVAENFRLSTLEAQFNSQLDFYNRKMRERELGGSRRVAPAEPPPPDPAQGVIYGQGGHASAVEILYKGLYLQSGNRNPSMDLEKFREFVGRQAETIRAKTGCSDIQFRVEIEEGKPKLKAKPVR